MSMIKLDTHKSQRITYSVLGLVEPEQKWDSFRDPRAHLFCWSIRNRWNYQNHHKYQKTLQISTKNSLQCHGELTARLASAAAQKWTIIWANSPIPVAKQTRPQLRASRTLSFLFQFVPVISCPFNLHFLDLTGCLLPWKCSFFGLGSVIRLLWVWAGFTVIFTWLWWPIQSAIFYSISPGKTIKVCITRINVRWCAYDINHIYELRIKNRSESDLRSCEVTKQLQIMFCWQELLSDLKHWLHQSQSTRLLFTRSRPKAGGRV